MIESNNIHLMAWCPRLGEIKKFFFFRKINYDCCDTISQGFIENLVIYQIN